MKLILLSILLSLTIGCSSTIARCGFLKNEVEFPYPSIDVYNAVVVETIKTTYKENESEDFIFITALLSIHYLVPTIDLPFSLILDSIFYPFDIQKKREDEEEIKPQKKS